MTRDDEGVLDMDDDLTLVLTHRTETVELDSLKPHPKNYNKHDEAQLKDLMESLRLHGQAKNVVVSTDGVLLAGHGTVEAAKRLGLDLIEVKRLPYTHDDPRAIHYLLADNEIARIAVSDERAKAELLRDLAQGGMLEGTGFDPEQLALLVMVTRHVSEIQDYDAAKEWVGMPSYDWGSDEYRSQLVINFRTPEDRKRFGEITGLDVDALGHDNRGSSTYWPPKENDDLISVRFSEVAE